jgi:hypothetical protein
MSPHWERMGRVVRMQPTLTGLIGTVVGYAIGKGGVRQAWEELAGNLSEARTTIAQEGLGTTVAKSGEALGNGVAKGSRTLGTGMMRAGVLLGAGLVKGGENLGATLGKGGQFLEAYVHLVEQRVEEARRSAQQAADAARVADDRGHVAGNANGASRSAAS